MKATVLLLVCALSLGCFRTHYVNFSPLNPNRAPSRTEPVRTTGWQSFFIYGWGPGELNIDARRECGGTDNIHSIETRRTFLQGLVTAFAGYYINIYSPWNGAVLCRQRTPAP